MTRISKVAFSTVAVLALVACTPVAPKPGVALPRAPAYYLACFNKLTPIPAEDLTRSKVVELVAQLRKSELAKSRCGKDLLAWYDKVSSSFRGN